MERMLDGVLHNLASTTGVLLTTAGVIILITLSSYVRYLISTPGPWGLPLLGYYPFLRKDAHVQLHELAKKYGEVYLINVAGQTYMYFDNVKALREAHVNKADFFAFRSQKHSMLQYCFDKSVAFLKGEEWRVLRKFFSQSMREIGLSPNKAELKGPIGDAIRSTINTFRESKEEVIDVTAVLSKECSSSVLRLFLGDDVSDEDATGLNEAYLKMLLPMSETNILLTGTIARYLLLPRIRGYYQLVEGKRDMEALLFKILADHKKQFSVDQEPRDLIDLYLREKLLREKKGDPQAKYFTDPILVSTLVQMYGDGSLSIAVQIASFLRDLSLHRDVQDALFDEVSQVIGTERLPTWEDRTNLPLTFAAVKELFRVTKFFSIFPGLECTKETSVLGVRAPKGCITLMSFTTVHHDPRTYKNPDKFDPTRFLPGPSKEDDPNIFGMGKRSCIGEGLVMSEIFTFLSSLIQNFVFLPDTTSVGNAHNDVSAFEEEVNCKLRVIPRSSLSLT